MTRTFTLVMPMARINNPNRRGQHWAKVAACRAEMRETARAHAVGLDPIHGRSALTVRFQFPDHRPRDLDNYEIKGAIDGAVDVGVISDDRSTVLHPVTRDVADGRAPKGLCVMTFEFRAVEG